MDYTSKHWRNRGMGKRQNDESGKKQPPKPKAGHARRGGQIKGDLTAIRDRLDVMNARLGDQPKSCIPAILDRLDIMNVRLGWLSSTEQDLKLARQECAEGARLLDEMTKERDLAVRAKVQGISTDSKIVFVWSSKETTPDPEIHLVAKAFERLGGDPQIVYFPKDLRVEAMTDRDLGRLGLCRILNANDAQQERDRFVRELGEAHRRLAQNEEELSALRTITCSQEGAVAQEDQRLTEREAHLRALAEKAREQAAQAKVHEDLRVEWDRVCRENHEKAEEISRLRARLEEVAGLRERIEKSEAGLKAAEALSRDQADQIRAMDPSSSVRYAVTRGVTLHRLADPGAPEPKPSDAETAK